MGAATVAAMPAPSSEAEAWAASGAMALTGRGDGPALVAPDGVVRRVVELGQRLEVDALGLLGEHAAALGLIRAGAVSCGGSARLLPTGDGWVAVNLARDDDRRSIAAWLDLPGEVDQVDPWPAVAGAVQDRAAADVVAQGELLGLPVARVGEVEAPHSGDDFAGLSIRATLAGDRSPMAPLEAVEGLLVVDLSSLWAGPLCARVLADRGAQVVKVESTGRPDGARFGPTAFYDRLHAGTRSVALDLGTETGRGTLCSLIERADIVIEASRARALRGWGIEALEVLVHGRCRVWVSITGYGREADRVAFGDDAAAAGGLVAWDEQGPMFVADAVADPLTGLTAAAGVEWASTRGGCWLLDVSMAGVAAQVAGHGQGEPWIPDERLAAVPPSAPTAGAAAPALGVDNARVAADLGLALP